MSNNRNSLGTTRPLDHALTAPINGGGPSTLTSVTSTVGSSGATDPDIFCTRVEWRITDVAQRKIDYPKDQSIWSPEFSAGGLRNLQLEFFPNGRASTNLEGFCSIFFWCPEGTSIQYELFVGSHVRCPDEDEYDSRMGHGHSNFCLLDSEIDPADGSVLIGVNILDVKKSISYGSGLVVKRPSLANLMHRYTSVVENRHIGRVEWKITDMKKRIKNFPKGASIYSSVFSAANIRDMIIEFYPNGNANTNKPGYCALYLRCPEGTTVIVTLIVGEIKKGPISAKFDGSTGKGLPEFCLLENQIDKETDSLLIAIELKNPAGGSSFTNYIGASDNGGKPPVLNI